MTRLQVCAICAVVLLIGSVTGFEVGRAVGKAAPAEGPSYGLSPGVVYLQSGEQVTVIAAEVTPSPSPTPTPTPTPSPTPKPSPTPAPSMGVSVPATMDSTGATDVSAALNAWTKTVPNGSTIVFKAGGTYRLNTAWIMSGRSSLTIQGNGATLRSMGSWDQGSSVIWLSGSTGITIRNITLVGNSSDPGHAIGGHEYARGVHIVGGGDIEVGPNVTISNVYGDGVDSDYDADGVYVHDCTIRNPGRAAIVVLSGKNWLVERCSFYNSNPQRNSVGIIDIEPWENTGQVHGFTFRNNTIYDSTFYFGVNQFIAGAPRTGMISDITISDNKAMNGSIRGLIWTAVSRPARVTISNNVAYGPPAKWQPETMDAGNEYVGGVQLAHIDGLTVKGNVVTFSPAHAFANISDCTNVVKDF